MRQDAPPVPWYSIGFREDLEKIYSKSDELTEKNCVLQRLAWRSKHHYKRQSLLAVRNAGFFDLLGDDLFQMKLFQCFESASINANLKWFAKMIRYDTSWSSWFFKSLQCLLKENGSRPITPILEIRAMSLSITDTTFALTVCMSLHSRLGADSPLNSLTEDLIQLILVQNFQPVVNLKGSKFSGIVKLYKALFVTPPKDKQKVYQLKIELGNFEPRAGEAELDYIERLVWSIEKHAANRVYYKSPALSLQQHVHNLRVQEQNWESECAEAYEVARDAMERDRLGLW